MKQGIRFFLKPSVFFGQLQWSTNHWFILVAFLGLAALETHVGNYNRLYLDLTTALQSQFGLSMDTAIWSVTFTKILFMVLGAWLITQIIWTIGNQIGSKNSKRVLFRRMAIVFTVMLAGYTANHLSGSYSSLFFISMTLYFWGGLLGYYAIREQFSLNGVATWVVGAFAFLLVTTAWHFSNHALEVVAGVSASHSHGTLQPVAPRPEAPFKNHF